MNQSQHINMKTIGILGGMSDQATVAYYRLVNAAVNARAGGWNTAEVIISSVNFAHIERCVRTNGWDEAGIYLAGKAQGLERAGAQLLLCVSNTMHRVADVFTAGLAIPLLHIVDSTGDAIRSQGLTRVGLLGTKPVMAADYLKERYARRFDLEVMVPSEEEQSLLDRIIFDELVRGVSQPRSKAIYLESIDRLCSRGAQGIILGCTELFLLQSQADRPDVPMFDTTALHAQRAVDLAFG